MILHIRTWTSQFCLKHRYTIIGLAVAVVIVALVSMLFDLRFSRILERAALTGLLVMTVQWFFKRADALTQRPSERVEIMELAHALALEFGNAGEARRREIVQEVETALKAVMLKVSLKGIKMSDFDARERSLQDYTALRKAAKIAASQSVALQKKVRDSARIRAFAGLSVICDGRAGVFAQGSTEMLTFELLVPLAVAMRV